MAVLLTGGTGKVSVRLARILQEANVPFLLASRKAEASAPSGMPAIKFDWLDSLTLTNPFQHGFPGGERISSVSLIAPEVADPTPPMNDFIDYAMKEHGVKRFVLLAGSSAEPGGHHVGKVWQHLVDIGAEYCVLRPTWFMENFSEEGHRITIKEGSKIYTACGDGKIPFTGASDIAAVAFHALTDDEPHNTDYRVLGPELLTHDQVAAKLSNCLGRQVVHVKLTAEERSQQLMGFGLPEHYAKFLTWLETSTANGDEERMNDVVKQVSGRPPQNFDDFAQQNKSSWQ